MLIFWSFFLSKRMNSKEEVQLCFQKGQCEGLEAQESKKQTDQ